MLAISGLSAEGFLIGVQSLDAWVLSESDSVDSCWLFSFRRHASHVEIITITLKSHRPPKTSLFTFCTLASFGRESFDCKKLQQLGYQMEKFNKVLDIYRSKYPLEMNAFLKFMHERIDLPDSTLSAIQGYILKDRKKSDRISEEDLKLFFHVVAAAQAKVDFASRQIGSLTNYIKLGKFKSKKDKQDKQESTINEKTETFVEPKPVAKEEGKVVQSKPVQKKEPKIQKSITPAEEISPKKTETSQQKVEKQAKPAKETQSRSPKKQKKEPILPIIHEDIIDENRTTNTGFFEPLGKTEQFLLNNPDARMMRIESKKSIQITGYDKFGQNFINPIIKYRIVCGSTAVYRRYTQFQNLMSYLEKNYEGFILPELPPKQGIKSGFSYFWGIDEAFLNDRQLKLEEMLNALLNSRFISQDEILDKFLKDQDFEVEEKGEGVALGYLKSISSIAFNATALKRYGLAYYNYLTEFKKTDITTPVTIKYKEIQALLTYFLQIDHYRTSINTNFERRREISQQLGCGQKDRHLTITDFDKLTASTAAEIRNLNKQFEKYMGLKSQESWLNYLINQKQQENESETEELKREREDTVKRIRRMQDNLLESIETLRMDKQQQLQQLGCHMVNWRRKIHP